MNRQETTQRAVLAVGLWIAFAGMLWECPPVTVLPFPKGPSLWMNLAPFTQPWSTYSTNILVAVLLVAWLFRKGEVVIPFFVFSLTLFLSFVEEAFHPTTEDISQGKSMPFAAWMAYVIGSQLIKPTAARPDAERNGRELAMGIVASGYMMAALSKLHMDGLSWFDGRSMALMIMERAEEYPGPIQWLRETVSQSPSFCTASMGLALVIEGLGFLYLLPKWRVRYAMATIFMHCSIGLLLGYFHVDWWATGASIAWWSTSQTAMERAQAANRG